MALPLLIYEDLAPTRDYLQDVAKVLGKLQQVFLPQQPHEWQRGLEVVQSGLMTQPFMIKDESCQALLDFDLDCIELNNTSWSLHNCSAQNLLGELQNYLNKRGVGEQLAEPEFTTTKVQYQPEQAKALAASMWWAQNQFEELQKLADRGSHSPILLFPHHFDLSLVWFSANDEKQLSLGFSTGDETIAEPYFYITIYPESANFKQQTLPAPAYWQDKGFSGAVLPYQAVASTTKPAELLQEFVDQTWRPGRNLLATT